MKVSTILACAVLFGVGGYLALTDRDSAVVTGTVPASVPLVASDPRAAMPVVNVSWRREGFGLTTSADVMVRNNNAYAVRVDRISCRFRDANGATEDHAQGVYQIIQPRAEKLIRDIPLGFVSSDAKGIGCSVVGAQRGL